MLKINKQLINLENVNRVEITEDAVYFHFKNDDTYRVKIGYEITEKEYLEIIKKLKTTTKKGR